MDEVENGAAETRTERILGYVAGEPLLWPVALVVLCHIAAFVAPALILGFREQRLPALAAVALLLMMSFGAGHGEWQRKGRLAAVSAFLAAGWLLSIGAAWAAHSLGVF